MLTRLVVQLGVPGLGCQVPFADLEARVLQGVMDHQVSLIGPASALRLYPQVQLVAQVAAMAPLGTVYRQHALIRPDPYRAGMDAQDFSNIAQTQPFKCHSCLSFKLSCELIASLRYKSLAMAVRSTIETELALCWKALTSMRRNNTKETASMVASMANTVT